MTKTVKGAGRKRYTAQQKKHNQKDVVVGGGRDHQEGLEEAAKTVKGKGKRSKKAEEPRVVSEKVEWDNSETLGSNVARLREVRVTWRRIGEMANENGHTVPWPDGGRLLREMKRHLKGDSAPEPRARSVRSKSTVITKELQDETGMTRDEIIAQRMSLRSVPWDGESTDDELRAMLVGKNIVFLNSITGTEERARIPEDVFEPVKVDGKVVGRKQVEGAHTKIEHGERGPYVTFASVQGPFRSVSLSAILKVN